MSAADYLVVVLKSVQPLFQEIKEYRFCIDRRGCDSASFFLSLHFFYEIVSDYLFQFLWTTCFKSVVLSCQPVSGCNCIITKLLKFMQKKTLLPQSVHKLKRVWILCLISLCIAPLNAQTLYKIEMPNYILQASGTNTETLYIKNKES